MIKSNDWATYVALRSKLTLPEAQELQQLCIVSDVSKELIVEKSEEFHDGRCFVEHAIGILSHGGDL